MASASAVTLCLATPLYAATQKPGNLRQGAVSEQCVQMRQLLHYRHRVESALTLHPMRKACNFCIPVLILDKKLLHRTATALNVRKLLGIGRAGSLLARIGAHLRPPAAAAPRLPALPKRRQPGLQREALPHRLRHMKHCEVEADTTQLIHQPLSAAHRHCAWPAQAARDAMQLCAKSTVTPIAAPVLQSPYSSQHAIAHVLYTHSEKFTRDSTSSQSERAERSGRANF